MDAGTLSLGAAVAALVSSAAERSGEDLAEGVRTAVAGVVAKLRGHFAESGDVEAAAALARVEDPPAGEAQKTRLAHVIALYIEDYPEVRIEVQALVEEAQQAGLDLHAPSQTVKGQGNIAVQGAVDSPTTISQTTLHNVGNVRINNRNVNKVSPVNSVVVNPRFIVNGREVHLPED